MVLEEGQQEQKEESAGPLEQQRRMKPATAFAQLAEAAWWLEVVAAHDPGHAPRVQKNLGLAYLQMLRIAGAPPAAAHTLLQLGSGDYQDLFRDVARNVTAWYDPWRAGDGNWRPWAGGRLLEAWRAYLARPDAKHQDPDYGRIKRMFMSFQTAEVEGGEGGLIGGTDGACASFYDRTPAREFL